MNYAIIVIVVLHSDDYSTVKLLRIQSRPEMIQVYEMEGCCPVLREKSANNVW